MTPSARRRACIQPPLLPSGDASSLCSSRRPWPARRLVIAPAQPNFRAAVSWNEDNANGSDIGTAASTV